MSIYETCIFYNIEIASINKLCIFQQCQKQFAMFLLLNKNRIKYASLTFVVYILWVLVIIFIFSFHNKLIQQKMESQNSKK